MGTKCLKITKFRNFKGEGNRISKRRRIYASYDRIQTATKAGEISERERERELEKLEKGLLGFEQKISFL